MIEIFVQGPTRRWDMPKDKKKKLKDRYRPKKSALTCAAIDPKVRRECEDAGLDPVDWNIYFGKVVPSKATCEDCYERRKDLCAGGKEPVKCLRDDKRALMRLRSAR
jgi:hypothetical protein